MLTYWTFALSSSVTPLIVRITLPFSSILITLTITSNDQEGAQIAIKMIRDLTFKPEVGMVVKGKVVRIIPIGAFVELGGGKDGMVHISQVCNERIESIEPHLNVGDEVIVKVIKIDDKGRVNLTVKGVTDEEKASV